MVSFRCLNIYLRNSCSLPLYFVYVRCSCSVQNCLPCIHLNIYSVCYGSLPTDGFVAISFVHSSNKICSSANYENFNISSCAPRSAIDRNCFFANSFCEITFSHQSLKAAVHAPFQREPTVQFLCPVIQLHRLPIQALIINPSIFVRTEIC